MHIMVDLRREKFSLHDLRREKFSLHLSQCRVELYVLPCFSAKREASFLYTIVAIGPIPLAAEKSSGEKKLCSISLTRSSYALFLSSSFFR